MRLVRLSIQHGLSLIELMVAMTVGLLVLAVATGLFVSAKSGYIAQTDSAQILDTGRHTIDVVSRSIRQASYLNWDAGIDETILVEPGGPAVLGIDAKSLKSRSAGISSPMAQSVNGSDVLAIRFAGSGKGSNGDGTVLNCAGFGVGSGEAKGRDNRGWSIFYVAEDASGEPELYCKYPGDESWASQAIARGVESFQVLYALDTDGDGYPNSFVNATTIDAMDNASATSIERHGVSAADGRQAHWRNVVAVKVAVLVRGAHSVEGQGNRYDLFGKPYSDAYAGRDRGVSIRVSELPKAVRNRARKVFTATIWLRNRPTKA